MLCEVHWIISSFGFEVEDRKFSPEYGIIIMVVSLTVQMMRLNVTK